MVKVRSDLCRGCGICVENCLQHAISIVSGTAYIIQERCNQCLRCVEVCPHGAVMEIVPVSVHELKDTVTKLKDKTADIIARIENIKNKQGQI